MIPRLPQNEKYCFVYCGPERCDCWRGNLSFDPFAIADTNAKRGDAPKIAAPSLMSGGGADRQSHNTSPITQSTD